MPSVTWSSVVARGDIQPEWCHRSTQACSDACCREALYIRTGSRMALMLERIYCVTKRSEAWSLQRKNILTRSDVSCRCAKTPESDKLPPCESLRVTPRTKSLRRKHDCIRKDYTYILIWLSVVLFNLYFFFLFLQLFNTSYWKLK